MLRPAHPLLLLALSPILAGCGAIRGEAPPQSKKEPASPRRVRAIAAAERPWPTTVTVQGSLLADETAEVGSKVAGRVKETLVDLGTPVRAGDILAKLETEEFDLRVQQGEAQVDQIRATLGLAGGEETVDRQSALPVREATARLREAKVTADQARDLFRRNAGTYLELETAEAAFKVAEAQYATAQSQVDELLAQLKLRRAELNLARQARRDAEVRAPFDGVVQARRVTTGAYVSVGDPIATVVRVSVLRFRGGVPERRSLRVKSAQDVSLRVEGGTEAVAAKVCRITPALDMASRALTIEADVPNPQGALRSGIFAEADIVVGPDDQALAIPASAVIEFAGVEKVWLIRDGKASEHPVQTGRRRDGYAEVLGGLKPGDQIVAEAGEGGAGPVIVTEAGAPRPESEAVSAGG